MHKSEQLQIQPDKAQQPDNSVKQQNLTVIQKEANFLSLINLQNYLSPSLFDELARNIDFDRHLPQRYDFDGQPRKCSFQELKVNSIHQNSFALSDLIENQDNLARKISNFSQKKNSNKMLKNPIKTILNRNRTFLQKQFAFNQNLKSKEHQIVQQIQNHDNQLYQRLKTVFGHANIQEGNGSPIYNCKFDLEDKFIITGADDGIIKIWSKDTMVLQASLHGHQDMIIDIALSKCNRYMASGSKDGVLILWDLQKCTIITRLTQAHTSQINKIQFVMIPCTHKQSLKNWSNLYGQQSILQNCKLQNPNTIHSNELWQYQEIIPQVQTIYNNTQSQEISSSQNNLVCNQNQNLILTQYDQFLISCSDDGSINIYDVSSFKNNSFDEFYTRGFNNTDKIYTVHSKHTLNQKLYQQQIKNTYNQLALKEAIIKKNELHEQDYKEPEDKVSRRTRKKQLTQGGTYKSITNQTTAQSSSQSQNNNINGLNEQINIFQHKLRPEDFRLGSRNKHIDSFSVNQKGFLAGGTNQGEVYLWKINFQNIRAKKNADNLHVWINSFKLHKKANHYLEFSPFGDMLLTGSADGTASIWDTSFTDNSLKKQKDQKDFINQQNVSQLDKFGEKQIDKDNDINLKKIEITDKNLIYKFEEKLKENETSSKIIECLIDGIQWSVKGRYAFCAITVKEVLLEDSQNNCIGIEKKQIFNKRPAIVKIKVYDTYSKQIIENLDAACCLGKEIYNYSSVLKSHPVNENILLSCFDGGITIIYDIQSKQVLQQIVEYGIYSIEQFTMNNAVDIDFSSDGEYIALSSIYGTLSLFTTQSHKRGQYAATRVQQFFTYDNEMHDYNPFERQTSHPQLCGYELNPYEIQPSEPIIGLHANKTYNDATNIEQASENFQRQQVFAREFSQEEEKFYADQLKEGMIQGYFNNSATNEENTNNNLTQLQQIATVENITRLYNSIRTLSNLENIQPFINPFDDQMHEESDFELLQNQNINGQIIRRNINNRQTDIDEASNDLNMEQDEDDDDEDFDDNKSFSEDQNENDEEDKNKFTFQQKQNGTGIAQRRQNYHQINVPQNHLQQNLQSQEEEEEKIQSRSLRRNRRNYVEQQTRSNGQNLQCFNQLIQDQYQIPNSVVQQSQEQQRQRKSRRRVIIHSGETSMFLEQQDDESNYGERNRRAGLRQGTRNARRSKEQLQIKLTSSGEESQDDYDSENSFNKERYNNSKRNNLQNRKSQRNVNKNDDQRIIRNSRKNYAELDNEFDQDQNENMSCDDSNDGKIKTRLQIQKQRKQSYLQNDQIQTRNRQGLRNRNQRTNNINSIKKQRIDLGEQDDSSIKIYERDESIDNYSLLDSEIIPGKQDYRINGIQEVDENLELFITSLPNQMLQTSTRDDNFSQRGNKSKKGSVIIREGRMPIANVKNIDEIYILKNCNSTKNELQFCYFCNRNIDQHTLIGPFDKNEGQIQKSQEDEDVNIIEENTQQKSLYFHQKCLEFNNYVRYDKSRQIWKNIDTAIQYLILNNQYTCYRCLQKGATVQCCQCDRSFHGHYCQNQYMLPTGIEGEVHICFFCRNSDNYDMFKKQKDQLQLFKSTEIDMVRKRIQKDHLFETKPLTFDNYYVPQLGDQIMYFYQGHENFIQSNNCFFYSGINKLMSSTDLPWMRLSGLKNLPQGQVQCKVINICHKFPHSKSTKLLLDYGNCSSDINQIPQIITYIELEVTDQNVVDCLKSKRFIIPTFPSECYQYIIPIELYNYKFNLFQRYFSENKLYGKRFKTHKANQQFSGHEIKICEVQALEPDTCALSFWESIVVCEVDQNSLIKNDRTRRNELIKSIKDKDFDRSNIDRINFWDLIYPEETTSNLSEICTQIFPKAFEENENQRLLDVFRMFISKKFETCQLFLERVPESLAHDYKCYVHAEMWLNLINERLQNKYYRSQDQLWFDIDLISHCSQIYNGEKDDVTVAAEVMIEKLRKELKSFININNENKNPTQKQYTFKNQNQSQSLILGFDKNVYSKTPQSNQNLVQNSNKISASNKSQKFESNNIGQGGQQLKELLQNQEGQNTLRKENQIINYTKSNQQSDSNNGNILMQNEMNSMLELQRCQKYSQEENQSIKRRGRPKKQQIIDDENPQVTTNGQNLINSSKDFSCIDNNSYSVKAPLDVTLGMKDKYVSTKQNTSKIEYINGVITIDQSYKKSEDELGAQSKVNQKENNYQQSKMLRQKRSLKQRKQQNESCSEDSNDSDFESLDINNVERGSNAENTMNNNLNLDQNQSRSNKRRRIDF